MPSLAGAANAGRPNDGRGGAAATPGGRNSTAAGAGATLAAGAGGATSSGSTGLSGAPGRPPDPTSDGSSIYARECHGDSLECADLAVRCLGIREADRVFGYSCSNLCDTVDDCSDAPSGAEAAPGCVPFVSSRYCLLVCRQGDATYECPMGMSCYVYPGTTLGYCLWQ